jgi:Na+/proline symporter
MNKLNYLDYSMIIGYFIILVVIGLYLKKRASASMDDYFLGGRKLPWWALGISGMAAWLDMTGTMLVVSFLYMMGPRALFIEFRGGAGLVLVFLMIWMGKWYKRSGVMTNAEWMIFRFGNDKWGQIARVSQAIAMIVFGVGMLAYSFKGAGMFLATFLPFSPLVCSIIMIVVTTIYTLESGFYGVVVTEIFQAVCILFGVVFIVIIAVTKVAGTDIAAIAYEVTGSADWTTSHLAWKTTMPEGYENYTLLTMVASFYLLKTVIQGMGIAGDPKFFGARNERETGLLCFLSGWTLMMRWPLMMAFALLGIFLVKDLFPDQAVLSQARDVIVSNIGGLDSTQWHNTISSIAKNSQNYNPEMISQLESLLGDDWQNRINLLGYHGNIDPEKILPSVLLWNVPLGLRGLLLVSLIAAAMSTFSAIINITTSFWSRDIYQAYIRPQAKNKELITTSHLFGLVLVICGFIMAYFTETINDIWGWLTVGVAAGMGIPLVLRFYWWRFNGAGFAIGTLIGMFGVILQRFLWHDMSEVIQFIYGISIGLIGCISGTYMSKPTDQKVLENFYKVTRPFGLWKKCEHVLSTEENEKLKNEIFYDLISVPFALGWMITIYLIPLQLMIKEFKAASFTFVFFVISMVGLYKFWYRKLPKSDL